MTERTEYTYVSIERSDIWWSRVMLKSQIIYTLYYTGISQIALPVGCQTLRSKCKYSGRSMVRSRHNFELPTDQKEIMSYE